MSQLQEFHQAAEEVLAQAAVTTRAPPWVGAQRESCTFPGSVSCCDWAMPKLVQRSSVSPSGMERVWHSTKYTASEQINLYLRSTGRAALERAPPDSNFTRAILTIHSATAKMSLKENIIHRTEELRKSFSLFRQISMQLQRTSSNRVTFFYYNEKSTDFLPSI